MSYLNFYAVVNNLSKTQAKAARSQSLVLGTTDTEKLKKWVKELAIIRLGAGSKKTEATLRISQDPFGDLGLGIGATVWDCALALIGYLECEQSTLFGANDTVAVELGSGTGAVGIAAHLLGAFHSLCSDRPLALPLLRHNIAANPLPISAGRSQSIACVALDWCKASERPLACRLLTDAIRRCIAQRRTGVIDEGKCQVLFLLSDVICFERLYDELVATLNALVSSVIAFDDSLLPCIKVRMAFERRKPLLERRFFELLQQTKVQCEAIAWKWTYQIVSSTESPTLFDSEFAHCKSPDILFCFMKPQLTLAD